MERNPYRFVTALVAPQRLEAALGEVFEARGGLYTTGQLQQLVAIDSPSSVFRLPRFVHSADEMAKCCAPIVQAPVILFETDFSSWWAYYLFDQAGIVDKFSTIPISWNQKARRLVRFKGNPRRFASAWPGVTKADVAPYYSQWDRIMAPLGKKAHPDDLATNGSGWQVIDFMIRIGLPFERSELVLESDFSC